MKTNVGMQHFVFYVGFCWRKKIISCTRNYVSKQGRAVDSRRAVMEHYGHDDVIFAFLELALIRELRCSLCFLGVRSGLLVDSHVALLISSLSDQQHLFTDCFHISTQF